MSALSLKEQLLKRAARELTTAAGGGEGAGTACRLAKSQLLAAGSVNEPERFLPIDAVGDLEDVTRGTAGWPHVTRVLARRQGFTLVRMPEPGESEADLLAFITATSKESDDVIAALIAAVRSGITRANAGQIKQQAWEMAEIAMRIHAAAARMEEA